MPRRWTYTGIGLLLISLVTLLVVLRKPLVQQFWPDTQVQDLLVQGDQALRAGRLSSADGHGARQYFEAALALDVDRGEARDGLGRVAEQALANATRALQRGQLPQARQDLALARELQVPRARADELDAILRKRESEAAGVDDLLAQADQAMAQGRLDGATDAALPLYQQVLALQPGRLEALEGREDAIADLLQPVNTLLERGDLLAAAMLVQRARLFDAGHADLPQAQANLARALELRRRQADAQLAQGQREQALANYRRVLAVTPDDPLASQGMQRVALDHAAQARRFAADYRFPEADTAIRKASAIAADLPEVRSAAQDIARSRQRSSQLPQGVATQANQQRLAHLLDEMTQAEQQGNWLSPPGESAYDKLRAAQAIAADDPGVRQAASRLLPAVEQCFKRELEQNRIGRAQSCLEAWRTLEPADRQLQAARAQLAQKWIAVGNERLGAGEIDFAARALAEARQLDSNAAGLDEFAERVRNAQAGGG